MKWKVIGEGFEKEPLIEAKDHREATEKAVALYCTFDGLMLCAKESAQ